MRSRGMNSRVQQRIAEYAARLSGPERHEWQLARFNEVWGAMSDRVPAYAALKRSGRAPARFENWEQFRAQMPEINKRDIQTRAAELTDPSRPGQVMYTTGGSTGEPTSIPGWKSEARFLIPDRWMARSWYGISPQDDLFMIWGHHHLLGQGPRARVRGLLRRTKDRLLGYRRFSAYNLDEQRMLEAGDAILAMRPRYIIGYSGSLDLLARANAHRAHQFAVIGLRAVIASGEVFPAADSVQVIGRTLGAPMAMEYGSIETGVMAYTAPHPSNGSLGRFQVMWRSYFIEAGEPSSTGSRPLFITALFPMKFPLIRFRIGDEAMIAAGESPVGLAQIDRIVGRTIDSISLAGGGTVHFDIFEQAATSAPEVRRFQLVVCGTDLTLNIHAPGADHDRVRRTITATLLRLDPRVAKTRIEFTEHMVQSIAGKTPILVRRAATAA